MPYLIEARLGDVTLSATIETPKEAFAKAIEWQVVERFSGVTKPWQQYLLNDEFASVMAHLEIETTIGRKNGEPADGWPSSACSALSSGRLARAGRMIAGAATLMAAPAASAAAVPPKEAASRRIHGRVCGWRAMHAISLAHVKKPFMFWVGAEAEVRASLRPAIFVNWNYEEVHFCKQEPRRPSQKEGRLLSR
jgi:hypothetical protein